MKKSRKATSSTDKEYLYRDIFDAAPNGGIVLDASNTLIVEANPAALRMHGYARDEFIGCSLTEFTEPDSRHVLTQHARSVEPGKLFEAFAIHRRKDGSSFNVEWRGTSFTSEGRHYVFLSVRDISQRIEEENMARSLFEERVREQSALLEISEAFASAIEVKPAFILEQFRGIIEYTHGGLFAVEESTLVVLTTHSPKELEQAPPLNIQLDVPETLTAIFKKNRPIIIADVKSDDPPAQFLRSFLKNESATLLKGTQSWMWVPLSVKGRIVAVIGLAHSAPDYFKARHAELAMTIANQVAITLVNAELFEDAQALAVLQERQRLARNLHDAVNQSLFSAGLIAEVLPRLWEQDQQDARRSLKDLRKLTRGAIAEMRMLVAELRPLALTESNLKDLLHLLANAFTGRTNIPVAVTVTGKDALVSEVQVAVYRICQEAMNNIAKHAAASRVRVKLDYTGDRVELYVQDNGRGFDSKLGMPGHYGLSMMNERAEAVGAKLEIHSELGKGTEIILHWQAVSPKENI